MKHAIAMLAFSALSTTALAQVPREIATINQQGSLGTATIEQEIVTPPFFEASIFQGPGVGSRASIRQFGVDAHATINQSGDRQTARVVQNVDNGHISVTQG